MNRVETTNVVSQPKIIVSNINLLFLLLIRWILRERGSFSTKVKHCPQQRGTMSWTHWRQRGARRSSHSCLLLSCLSTTILSRIQNFHEFLLHLVRSGVDLDSLLLTELSLKHCAPKHRCVVTRAAARAAVRSPKPLTWLSSARVGLGARGGIC